VILVLYEYGDTQNGTGGARLGVSEAGVKPVDSVVRLVCRDAWAAESRLGCGVIPIRDFATGQFLTMRLRNAYN
jgi:hypothetical protein